MRITNNANLPKPIEDAAKSDYTYTPKRYSVTSLLKPTRQLLLTRRHNDEIEQDCADMIWMLFGQAVHKLLEEKGDAAELFKEEKLVVALDNGYTISGILDLYNIDTGEVADYKTCSTWKVIYGDYEDWRKQGLMYAWLLRKNNLPCKKVVFYALMKDWSKPDVRKKHDYPKQSCVRVEYDVTEESLAEIDRYIQDKMADVIANESVADEALPLCPAEDRWNTGTKYAVMKKGRKTAMRVCDSREDALVWREENGGDYIEERQGEDKRCKDYCSCCAFCPYYKEHYANDEEGV